MRPSNSKEDEEEVEVEVTNTEESEDTDRPAHFLDPLVGTGQPPRVRFMRAIQKVIAEERKNTSDVTTAEVSLNKLLKKSQIWFITDKSLQVLQKMMLIMILITR